MSLNVFQEAAVTLFRVWPSSHYPRGAVHALRLDLGSAALPLSPQTLLALNFVSQGWC